MYYTVKFIAQYYFNFKNSLNNFILIITLNISPLSKYMYFYVVFHNKKKKLTI